MNKLLSYPSRPLWGLVVALLLLNTALVGWLVVAPSVAAPTHVPQRTAGAAFLPDTLHFSAEQRRQYELLRANYQSQVRPLTQACRRECQQYFLLIDSVGLTDAQLAAKSRAALERKVAVDVATARHLQQVAALCTPEQRGVLRRVLAPDCTEKGCVVPAAVSADRCVKEM